MVKILEKEKYSEVYDKACRDAVFLQPCGFLIRVPGGLYPLYPQGAQIGRERGKQQQQCVFRVPAHIKILAGRQKPQIAQPVRNHVVYKQH